jgi:catechol 2,3-dioxygenase-like lactoylglutathione lyase family enzyme
MQLHGTINHVALTVSNLDEAMRFFQPFFEFFGYTVSDPGPYAGTRLCVSVNELNGIAINVWEAKASHPFEVYEPGLHHLALNAGSKAQVDHAHAIVTAAELEILDGPGEFPFAADGYYAFYFLGPDGLKLEVVYMPELDRPATR